MVKFIPVAGPLSIDACFKTMESAEDVFKSIGKIDFTDDFGIRFALDTKHYSVILTNSEASAETQRELSSANADAVARQNQSLDVGSSLQ